MPDIEEAAAAPQSLSSAAANGVPWNCPESIAEPKYLGLCGPAWSICGCTLQSAVRALGVLIAFTGGLRTAGSLVVFDVSNVVECTADLLTAIVTCAAGCLLWQATVRLHHEWAMCALWFHAAMLCQARILTTAKLQFKRPLAYDKATEQLISAWQGKHHTPVPPEVAEQLRRVAVVTVNSEMWKVIVITAIATLALFAVESYFVWSWAARVKRRELALVLYGVQPSIIPIPGPGAPYVAVYPPTQSLPPALAAALFERQQQGSEMILRQAQQQHPLLEWRREY